MPKNEPKLIDLVLRKKRPSRSRDDEENGRDYTVVENVKIHSAKRFVLDYDASAFFGQLMRRAPIEILRQHQFAKPPYDNLWIEFDHNIYYKEIIGKEINQNGKENPADKYLGIYVVNNKIFIFFSDVEKKTGMYPFVYQLHKPMSFEQELRLAERLGVSRLIYRQTAIGGVTYTTDPWWNSAEATDICRSHTMEILPMYEDLEPETCKALLLASAGNLKIILGLLLLLTRPHNSFDFVEVGPHRGIIKGKALALRDHHVIKMRLEHGDPVTRYLAHESTGIKRRGHDVRGHWAQHRKRGIDCDHQWQPLDINTYQCVVCGIKRWWKKNHHRGSDNIGKVTKEYQVIK